MTFNIVSRLEKIRRRGVRRNVPGMGFLKYQGGAHNDCGDLEICKNVTVDVGERRILKCGLKQKFCTDLAVLVHP